MLYEIKFPLSGLVALSQVKIFQNKPFVKFTFDVIMFHVNPFTVKNFNTSKPDLVLQFKTNDYIIRLLVIELSEKYLGRVKRAFRLLKPNFGLVI